MKPFSMTSCKDRTAEFQSIAERLQRQNGASTSSSLESAGNNRGNAKSPAAQQSEFAAHAARIGQGIHKTSQKLLKLSQLAKRTSKFDDPAEEINEISGLIKKDIQALNMAIADLQNRMASSREASAQSINHSHTVVLSLQSRLKDTTQEFKEVLTLRQENLRQNQGRRQLFSQASENGAIQSRPGLGLGRGSSGKLFGSNKGGSAEEGQPLLPTHNTQAQQQQQLVATQDSYLSSRAEALHNVEATIHELSNIFMQLNTMVQEQGEMAIRIDENVDETVSNVDAAQAQLLRYLNAISSNRWLFMKIFAVLVVFLVIFVVFIA